MIYNNIKINYKNHFFGKGILYFLQYYIAKYS